MMSLVAGKAATVLPGSLFSGSAFCHAFRSLLHSVMDPEGVK